MALDKNESEERPAFKQIENPSTYIEILRRKKISFESRSDFNDGDIVAWKPGMKNRTAPEYGQPGIVMSILDTPISNADEDPFSTYYNEILDVEIGFSTSDDGFIIFLLDSRRLEIYNQTYKSGKVDMQQTDEIPGQDR